MATEEVINLRNTEELDDDRISRLIDRSIQRKAAIDKQRAEGFGGLLKGLTDKQPAAQRKVARFFEFLHCVHMGDRVGARKVQQDWIEEYKGVYSDEELKALDPSVEGTTTKGGYLVPPEFAADLARILGEYGYARQYCRTWQMSSNLLNVQSLGTKPSVAFTAEGAAIAATKPVIGRTPIEAKKIAGMWVGSNELIADANIDLYTAILEIFGEQFSLAEDTNVFQNSATNWKGILYHCDPDTGNDATILYRGGGSTAGLTGYPQIGDSADAIKDILSDMLRMLSALNMAYIRGAAYFMPQEIFAAILGLRDSNKRLMLDLDGSGLQISTGFNGAPKMYFHGFEMVALPKDVMLTGYDAAAHVTTPFMVFANLKRAWCTLGIRGGFEVLQLQEGTVDGSSLAEKDLRGIRMTERLAFDTVLPSFLIGLSTDAS